MDEERIFFVTSGESLKKKNEIHLVEYLSLLGSATCQGVLTTDKQITKMRFDDKKTKKLFVGANSGEESFLTILDRELFQPKKVTCKEDTYRISKDMISSKIPLDENSSIKTNFDFSR